MTWRITVLPQKQNIDVSAGTNLLEALRTAGMAPDSPCGGSGNCGKCKVLLDGAEVLACQTAVDRNMTVTVPEAGAPSILASGSILSETAKPQGEGYALAFDIGTTTVVGYLLSAASGQELACTSRLNPQTDFGADVISRIRHALNGHLENLTFSIRRCVAEMIRELCRQGDILPAEIRVISLVGNPAMQQLFLGISPENLACPPFSPVLTEANNVSAKPYLPLCENAQLLIVPDISGFVGADTVACVLASGMDRRDEITLLVDIGTNGEMVLGNRCRMVACSAAAGPALEGANIQFGMRGQTGAIDHVWPENNVLKCSVIGGGKAAGICGSGLIDAVAAALDQKLLNSRGRIQNETHIIPLTDRIHLTQDDIRQVQLAKGAIAAGIELMTAHLDISPEDINQVFLAGAFGSFMDAKSVCRIGLLPPVLEEKIQGIGNAAGIGARLLACNTRQLNRTQQLVSQIEFLELAAAPGFQRCFAKNMRF